MKNQLYLTLILSFFYGYSFAQRLTTETDVCPAVAVQFNAPSLSNAAHYDWDFCPDDLTQTPTAELINPFISFMWRPEAFDIAFDDNINEWVGLIANRGDGSLVRMNFGANINEVPTFTNLGTLGNLIVSQANSARRIKIFKYANNWYAFMLHLGVNSLRLYNFGTSLNNTPTLNFLSPIAELTNPTGMDVVIDNGNIIVAIANATTNPVLINFGNSPLTVIPTVIPLPNLGATDQELNIKLIKENNTWAGVVTGATGSFYVLNFGNTLFDNETPIYINLASQIPASVVFRDLELAQDGKNTIAFSIVANGHLYRFNFGQTLTSANPRANPINLGNFSLLGTLANAGARPSLTLSLVKRGSEWFAFSINRDPNNVAPANINQLIRLRFPNVCNSTPVISTQTNPSASFTVGKKIVQLQVQDSDRNLLGNFVDSVNVLNATIAQFSPQNQCLGETTQFVNLSVGSDAFVSSWEWDFGDNTSSNAKSPSKVYTQPGIYQVKLRVNNTIGCANTFTRQVRISQRPIANFEIIALDCTTGSIILKDNSEVSATDKMLGGFITTRIWNFGDGRGYTAAPDTITYIRKGLPLNNPPINSPLQVDAVPYPNNGTYQITLTVIDETGCAASITKTITLRSQDAPVVNFAQSGLCQNVPIQFQDTSALPFGVSGQITAWDWTFFNPDGNVIRATSNQPNPRHTYAEPGVYPVRLTVRNSNGCFSTLNRSLTIQASLESRFNTSISSGIAPLTVQFFNQSSGASSYWWDFGNGRISTLESPTFTFAQAGLYDVSFQARNASGCGTIATQRIVVGDTPTAIEDYQTKPFKIYPNPASDYFVLAMQKAQAAQAILRDGRGKEIYKFHLAPDQDKHSIPLQDLPSGLYLLQVKIGDQSYFHKVIKQ
ncbi:MAG: PKD domain-containing protein [Microscillaceae bacterium]|nr:PKD domain-containing protein [Microscillaceae bacterium]